ncbi:peptidyl-prolyl cis-trans isomerase CYP95-like isoform X1 [Gastrolobium bilobum]|uniref:peptidyl-prolyl cis-trans isomerase CYP95-like isoform X1 n=1 Tax=Gastrolobium bilobum TaxID=150636 RepID=UPI002AB0C603|nr:peptidyl-prolyl cis-trans isomerase CYP95-like isoform X1 [Gastrolobium bilobum]
MAKKKNPLVFMDVSIDGDPVERMVFELFYDVAPKTAENFRALCTGERGVSQNSGKSLHYKGSFFHHIVKGSIVRGGDFVNRNGTGGESIYGSKFPDESPRLKHDAPGLLSMAITDRDTLGSHFIITLKADHHLDRKHVVFGKLVQGHNILKKIEDVGDEEGHPTVTVKIINCGEYNEDGKKINKLKLGRDGSSEAHNHEARQKVKHKKSSGDRRKRRKYYSSESNSTSDSDMESSKSDSDSDSDVSSSSYTSSSSDGRQRKRKRSRKDKHRQGKRRDKHRDKRRRKRDKRSKHRSRRESSSLTDSDSESKSDNSSDSKSLDAQGRNQKHKDHSQRNAAEVQSPLVVEKELPPMHLKKREEVGMLEEEFSKENGEQHRNGIGANHRSDRGEERQPDVMDDHPGKSRSRSMSPKQTMSKNICTSPKSESKSPSVSPKRRLSRSPVRSISRSPNSRSPVRGRKERSISRSPVRTRDHESVSRSPVRSRDRRNFRESPVRSLSRSRRSWNSPKASSRRTVSRSPVGVSRKSLSRSPIRSSARSLSRSSGRVPLRSISQSPVRVLSRGNRQSYSRSRSPVRRERTPHGRSLSRSVSPDASPKRIRRGRGFSERYSYARRYRTPSRSPARSYRYNGRSDRYNGRSDRDRYSGYRRYSPRRYRGPQPRGRTPPRYRTRRSRTPSVSRSPRYRARRYSRSRSPVRSHSPVDPRSRASPRAERHIASSQSRSPSRSRSSVESQSPRKASRGNMSRSSSGSPAGKKGLVSYGDGSPDSSQR